jgi:hypothetical protein
VGLVVVWLASWLLVGYWLVTGWLFGWLASCWLTAWLVAGCWLFGCWVVGWLACWLSGWLVAGWLAGWLVGWFVGWLDSIQGPWGSAWVSWGLDFSPWATMLVI